MCASRSGIERIPACMCFSEEETRQWQGSEGESEAWNFWETSEKRRKKKNKGRRENPAVCLGVSAAAGNLSFGSIVTRYHVADNRGASR